MWLTGVSGREGSPCPPVLRSLLPDGAVSQSTGSPGGKGAERLQEPLREAASGVAWRPGLGGGPVGVA